MNTFDDFHPTFQKPETPKPQSFEELLNEFEDELKIKFHTTYGIDYAKYLAELQTVIPKGIQGAVGCQGVTGWQGPSGLYSTGSFYYGTSGSSNTSGNSYYGYNNVSSAGSSNTSGYSSYIDHYSKYLEEKIDKRIEYSEYIANNSTFTTTEGPH